MLGTGVATCLNIGAQKLQSAASENQLTSLPQNDPSDSHERTVGAVQIDQLPQVSSILFSPNDFRMHGRDVRIV